MGLSNHCQVTSGLIFRDPSQLSTTRQPGLTQHSYRLVPWLLKELTARGYLLSTLFIARQGNRVNNGPMRKECPPPKPAVMPFFQKKGITDVTKDHDMRSSWIMQVGLKSDDMSI